MAKYLITGGAGFIGSNLAHRLVSDGHKVVIFDNFSTGKKDNLKEILKKVEIISADIRDKPAVKKATTGVDYILHHAAVVSVRESINRPEETEEINVQGTLNILMAAKNSRVKRFVFASSAATYDHTVLPPLSELSPKSPKTPYGMSKLKGEKLCREYKKKYGLPVIVLRYFNVFGPKQSSDSDYSAVIPKFIKLLLKRETPTIYGDGKQSRDFIFVDDIAQANILACLSSNLKADIFNIARGHPVTINELVNCLNGLLGTKIKPEYTAENPNEIKLSHADINLAIKYLGFVPKTVFEERFKKND